MSFLTPLHSFLNVMQPKITAGLGESLSQVIQPGPAHFAMVEKQALHNLDSLMCEDMNAARLIVSLIRLLEPGSGGVIVISRKTIQELLGVSESTVARCLRTLSSGGWVQRMRIGGAYALAVNKAVAWVGPRGEMARAVFSATVVASRSEQDAVALNPPALKQFPMTQPGESVLLTGEADPPTQELMPGFEPAIEGVSN
jgi:AraC-like DNA-binding protein